MSEMRKKEKKIDIKQASFVWFGLGFSVFYWILESVRDVFVFNRGSVIERIFYPDAMSFWMRILVVCIIVLFSVRAQMIRQKMQESADKINQSGSKVRIVRVGIGFSILYWILESLRDAFVFGKGPLLERLITPEPMGIWIRLLAIFILVLFSAYAQSIINTQRCIENVLRAKHEELEEEVKSLEKELDKSRDLLEKNISLVNVDLVKNRLYVRLKGTLNLDAALRLKQDYQHAINKCKPGFDVVNDVEGLKPCEPAVITLLGEISGIADAAGVGRVVRVERTTRPCISWIPKMPK